MAAGFVHTVYKGGKWINELEDGGPLPGDPFDVKEVAVAAGRKHAMDQNTEHVIHNEDGVISERNSYGNDPASRPG